MAGAEERRRHEDHVSRDAAELAVKKVSPFLV